MSSAELVGAINAVAFYAFLSMLFMGSAVTGARYAYYKHLKRKPPKLLIRDLLVFGGLATSFGLILLVRALQLDLRENILYALGTDIPGVSAVGVYLYFELFVIETGTDPYRIDKLPTDRDPGAGE